MAVERRAARPVVAVEVFAVADRAAQLEASERNAPAQRGERRRGLLPLVGVVGRIEAVRAEGALLIAGLELEAAGPRRLVGGPQEGVVVGKVGVVHVAVAAPVGGGREERQPLTGGCPRDVAVGVAVLAARPLEAQVVGHERRRADVDRPGIGAYARHTLHQVDARYAVDVDGQRVGLMARAGIREVDAVEHHHGLVEGASPYGDVRLDSLAATLPDVDRRGEAQGVLQRLKRGGTLLLSVEKRDLRHGVRCRGRYAPRYAHLVDGHLAVDGNRVGLLGMDRLRRKQENGHPDGQHSDGHAAVEARKSCPAVAAPTAPATTPRSLVHLEIIHLVTNLSW